MQRGKESENNHSSDREPITNRFLVVFTINGGQPLFPMLQNGDESVWLQ